MAEEQIIQARVWQKTDTLENWNANPLLLGPGEMALVTTPSGVPMNMKWGDKTTRKRFSDLPFAIAYDQGQFVAVSGTVLPASDGTVHYSLVGEGTYTRAGQSDVVVPTGKMGVVVDDGTAWSLSSTISVPSTPVSDNYDPNGTQAQSQKGVANIAFTKNGDGDKFVYLGLYYPKVVLSKYVNAVSGTNPLGALLANNSYKLKVFEIQKNSLSTIKLSGNFPRNGVFFLSQFKGDYNDPANFLRGQSIPGTVNTTILADYSIDPDAKFILLQDFTGTTPAPSQLNIIDVVLKSKKENQAVNFPFINYPVDSLNTYKLDVIKKSILDARINSYDSDVNYYQLSTISRANKQGTAVNNSIGIIRRKRSDDTLVSSDVFSNTVAVNVMNNNGVNTIVLKGSDYTVTLKVDCDSINEGSIYNLSNPPTDATSFDFFKKFEFDSSCYVLNTHAGDDSYTLDGYKHLSIGVNSPKKVLNKWLQPDGNIGDNGSFYYKYFEVVKKSIQKIRIVGKTRYGGTNYISEYKAMPFNSENFLGGRNFQGTLERNIDEWIDINPETRFIAISTSKTAPYNYDIDVADYYAGGSSVSPTPTQGVDVKKFGFSEFGYMPNLSFEKTDYHHFIFYGQSLLEGNAPSVAVNTFEIPNDFMAGVNPIHTGQTISSLTPLKSVNGENPFVTASHQFSSMYRMLVNPSFKSITNSCARGSRSIESLSKECTNTEYFDSSSGVNLYTNRFLGLLNKTKAVVEGLNETLSCPAIFYMQGESNYVGTGQGLTTGTNQTVDKETYKSLLLTLKNNMQNDVLSIYGQTQKPMFFIYQTGRGWLSRKDQSITQAQIEFAMENDDVVLMNPTYFGAGLGAGTGALSDHLCENASRWYGEQIAKAMYYTFIKYKESPVITLENIDVIDSNKILLSYKVPVLPLVFDDKLAIGKENRGYAIYNNGSLLSISDISIVNSSQVIITLTSDFTTGNLEVTYAGNTMKGRGNLRDSDTYKAMFEYTDYSSVKTNVDDYIAVDNSDNPIYGKKYPLFNWASHSYFVLDI